MIIHGNCLDKLKELPDNSVDSIVTDPPYELGFMGKSWDNTGIAYNSEMWAECLRVLKPGGHILAFSGTRTYHRMAVAIEDAGFEIRDMVEWVYGSGFPKSLNIGKAVDKIQGNEREVGELLYKSGKPKNSVSMPEGEVYATKGTSPWEGWGTALKPAHEPICLARKPIIGTVAQNVLTYGTGGLNIDKSRVDIQDEKIPRLNVPYERKGDNNFGGGQDKRQGTITGQESIGRFPANLIHDGSDEVVREFPNESERFFKSFFYCPKASKSERDRGLENFENKQPRGYMTTANGTSENVSKGMEQFQAQPRKNTHPTVKPLALMKYLIQMITPEGGVVLDPFAGSGSTLVAAKELGYDFIGIEMTEEYIPIIEARLSAVEEDKQLRLV